MKRSTSFRLSRYAWPSAVFVAFVIGYLQIPITYLFFALLLMGLSIHWYPFLQSHIFSPVPDVPAEPVTFTQRVSTLNRPVASLFQDGPAVMSTVDEIINAILGAYYVQFSKSRFPAEFRDSLSKECRKVFAHLPSLVRALIMQKRDPFEPHQDVDIERLDFGRVSPQVSNVVCRKSPSNQDILFLDFDAHYEGDASLEVAIRALSGVRVRVGELVVDGRMRLEWEFYPAPPFTRNLSLAFLDVPSVDLKVKVAQITVLNLPFLGDRIRADLLSLPRSMVLPKKWMIVQNESELTDLRDQLRDYMLTRSNSSTSSLSSMDKVHPATSTPLRPLAAIKKELDDAILRGLDHSCENGVRYVSTILNGLRELHHSKRRAAMDPQLIETAYRVLHRLAAPSIDAVADVLLQPENFAFLCLEVAEKCTLADPLLLLLFNAPSRSIRERVSAMLNDLDCSYLMYDIRGRNTPNSQRRTDPNDF